MAAISDLSILIIFLTALLCIRCILGVNRQDPNICSKNDIGNYDLFCCFNFHMQNGKCTECEIGTVSQDGIPCTKCAENSYGHQCKLKCSCLHNQRCDHRFGCVNDSHEISTEPAAEVTVHGGMIDIKTPIQPASSKTTFFYYALAGGMMGFSILCGICSMLFKKGLHARAAIEQHSSQQAIMMEPMRPHARSSLPPSLPPLPGNSRHNYEAVDF